jgi:hypothetical protein
MRIQEDDLEGGGDLESPQWDTLQQNKVSCTPVVIVEGSGKAADFIASTWRHMREGDRMCYGWHWLPTVQLHTIPVSLI